MSTRSHIFIKLDEQLLGSKLTFDMSKLPEQTKKQLKCNFVHPVPNVTIPEQCKYMGVYCHWNGAPEWNGAELLEHYNTPEQVLNLLTMGDLSTIVGEVQSYRAWRNENTPPTFYNGLTGYLIANSVYMPVKQVAINTVPCEIEYEGRIPFSTKRYTWVERTTLTQTLPAFHDDYAYLFDGEKWLFFDHHKPLKGWRNLAKHLKRVSN